MVRHRLTCGQCKGVMAKLYAQYSISAGTPGHEKTDFYYCLKCKIPTKMEIRPMRMIFEQKEKSVKQ